MFAIDDYVFYRTTGVCRIAAIVSEQFGDLPEQEYYVLKPVSEKSLAYVPKASEENSQNIRKLMSRDDILGLIGEMPDEQCIWVDNERDRREKFTHRLGTGDSHELMRLVKTLYLEKARRTKAGKRINAVDAKILGTAERLLNEELAFVLQIDPDAVPAYIREKIAEKESDRLVC